MAKLRPEHGSIAATLGRSAHGIEFLNRAIGFTNREFANRDKVRIRTAQNARAIGFCKRSAGQSAVDA
jgi:hypothetical protein